MRNAGYQIRSGGQGDQTAAAASTTPRRRVALPTLVVVIFAAPVLAYFWFVGHFGVNTIWIDQWSDLGVISRAYSGHLTLSTLWAQHTENRILFPNLVVLLLAHTTRFNVVDEEFLSASALVSSIALLIIGHRRRSPTTAWILYLPVAILMLSIVQSGNTLWGFQFAWYLVLLALSLALVLCDSSKWTWIATSAAIGAAIVGSYSSLQGLLIWPAGLVVLLLRNRPRCPVLTWIGAAAVTSAIYVVNFDPNLGGTNGAILHHPVDGVRFFLFSVGNVIGTHGGNSAVVLGVLIVLTSLWLVVWAVVRRGDDDAAPLGVALICFGLLYALTITIGRSGGGLDAGGGSRYTTFDLLTLVGCYLVLLSKRGAPAPSRRWERGLHRASVVVVGVAVSLQVVFGNLNGLAYAKSWHEQQVQASRVIANMVKAPDSMVERVLVANPYYVAFTRHMTRFAEMNHLSLFASEAAIRQYREAGLPYDLASLVTSIYTPRSGANVKGIVLLAATAASDYGITRVEFEILGPQSRHPDVEAAKDSHYGWLAEWNTDTVPNGQYTIHSVAYDAAGHRIESEPVTVAVHN